MKAGIVGCGNISRAYLSNGKKFKHLEIVACADMRPEASKAAAAEYGIRDLTVEQLLADKSIDTVLNLTTPESHVEINTRAIQAGKNVHCEKPFGLDREGAKKVISLAAKKGLRVGCAPDTFLGGGHQTCRKIIDDGVIGKVVCGTAFMLCHGHESWHPAPGFYYRKGGGPLFDMGPYYITALVNMLGPVKRVAALSNRSTNKRIGIKANAGKTFPVEIDTHISATLEFAQGAIVTLITSFDVWRTSGYRDIELHGTEGSLHVPDPNNFNGDIRIYKQGFISDWAPAENDFGYNDNLRIIGLADMAAGIANKRPHRTSGELAFHVLDVMCSIADSAANNIAVKLASTCERPAALRTGLKGGELD